MNDRASKPAPAEASQAPAPSPAAPNAPGAKQPEGSVKETIESIIIAFILAFIFRGFIVEAFVIPTGSMAPTLLGAHMRFHCPDCGYRFDVNYFSEGGEGDDINIPSVAQNRVFSAYCPNCSYKVPRFEPQDPHNDATTPQIRYGDRILVLKYLYLISNPNRWDVVVFKSPNEPEKHDFSQNYIKRLVGLPGEAIYILDGDVYVGKPGAAAQDFTVQTKPRHVQDALWRIVYNNDYRPRGAAGSKWVQPWKVRENEKGWDTSGRHFTFDNPSGSATLFFDASANPDHHALTDWLAYDQNNWNQRGGDTYYAGSYEPDANVSDVKLSFSYERSAGDGPLELVLSKLDYAFTATITPTSASLVMHNTKTRQSQVIAENVPLPSGRAGRARQVEFTNLDYQVTLRIDGTDLIHTTPQQYRPDMAFLLEAANHPEQRLPKPQVVITAQRQTATLTHVELWRDVYYLNRTARMVPHADMRPVNWASPHDFPENLMVLGKDEYFVIGDNSPISGDARTWSTPTELPDEDLYAKPGIVPARFLIGKAFFVYWPAGYRPMDTAPALVPNFGDMRFIH